jgi:alkyl hydroperoxide reductase subunit AhpC
MLFSHPKDFTPVCATELSTVAKLDGEFQNRGCKVIGLSVDTVDDHHKWSADIEELAGTKINFPIIADEDLNVAKLYTCCPQQMGIPPPDGQRWTTRPSVPFSWSARTRRSR